MAASNPTAVQGSIPAPAFAAYDPKDQTDPLHLHPSESPSLQLVTIPLEGRSNYHPWARAMEIALKSKNKMVLVDGSLTIPSNSDPKYFYWDQCNTMILSWILRAVSPTIGRSVLWINTAEGVWKDLKKRFSHVESGTLDENLTGAGVFFTKHETKRDVYFYEGSFPFQNSQNEQIDEIGLESDIVLPSGEVSHLDTEEQVQDDSIDQIQSVLPIQDEEPVTKPPPEIQPRRSTRTITVPYYLNDYTCQNATVKRTSPHTISNVLSYNSLSQRYKAFAVNALRTVVSAIPPLSTTTNVSAVTGLDGTTLAVTGRSSMVALEAVLSLSDHERRRVMACPRSAKGEGIEQLRWWKYGEACRQKSKKEVMEEIILNSKFFKAQKAKDKEENEQFVEQLEWRRRQFSGTRKSKNLDEQSEVSSSKGKRKNIRRRRCEALMKVRLNDKGAYEVAHHITSHNHPLTRKEWVHLHRPERKITSEKAQAIGTMISYGMMVVDSFRYIVQEAGETICWRHNDRPYEFFP
nr:uncharacterized protein LOC109166032 [Ipomoea batatas]